MRGGTREVRYQPVPRQTPRRLDPPRHGRWRFLIPPSHVQRRGAVELVAGALCELGAAVVGLEVLTDVDGEGRAVGVVVVTEVSRSSNCSTTTPFAPLTNSRTCLHATTGLSVARLAHSPCADCGARSAVASWLVEQTRVRRQSPLSFDRRSTDGFPLRCQRDAGCKSPGRWRRPDAADVSGDS